MTKQSKKTQGMVGGYLQTNNCSWCYLEPAPPFDAAAAFAAWWEAPAELTRWQWTNLQLLQDLRVTNRVFFCCHRTVCESQRQQLISLVTSRRSLPKGKVETRSHGGNWKPLLLEPSSGISKSAETEPLLQVTQAACTGATQGARNVRWDTFCFMLNRVLALGLKMGLSESAPPITAFSGNMINHCIFWAHHSLTNPHVGPRSIHGLMLCRKLQKRHGRPGWTEGRGGAVHGSTGFNRRSTMHDPLINVGRVTHLHCEDTPASSEKWG